MGFRVLDHAVARHHVHQRGRRRADRRPRHRSPRPQRDETRGARRKKILRRRAGWPIDRFGEVERAWPGATVVCCAGGPSLCAGQLERVRAEIGKTRQQIRLIAVNDAYRLAPFADLCYFADARWWRWHKDRPEFQAFAGQKCSIFGTGNEIDDPEVFMLRIGGTHGLSDNPEELRTGRTSGYQAINIATLGGSTRILLLAYDGKFARDGKSHWFGDHPVRSDENTNATLAKNLRGLVEPLAQRGVTVINCSPDSAVDCFPRMDLDAALVQGRLA